MLVKEIIDLYEILDSAYASGAKVAEFLTYDWASGTIGRSWSETGKNRFCI